MPLKFAVDSLDGLDESIQGLYTEQDGKFYLDVDGAVSTDKVSEFRNKNIELLQQLDKFKGVDLDKYQDALSKIQEQEKKKVISMDKVDGIVDERVQTMKDEYESQLKTINDQNTVLNSQLETLVIDSAVRAAATKHKVLGTAVDDVILRAKSTFKMKDGEAMPYDAKGNVIYGKDGQTPLTIDSWVKGLGKTANHLFEPSQGGGIPPGGNGNLPAGMNPENMSPMQKIQAGLQRD